MFGRRVRIDHLYEESRLKSIQSQRETSTKLALRQFHW